MKIARAVLWKNYNQLCFFLCGEKEDDDDDEREIVW